MELNYKNDPFLFGEYCAENFVTINNIKDRNLFLLPNGVLNLYSALIKSLETILLVGR